MIEQINTASTENHDTSFAEAIHHRRHMPNQLTVDRCAGRWGVDQKTMRPGRHQAGFDRATELLCICQDPCCMEGVA